MNEQRNRDLLDKALIRKQRDGNDEPNLMEGSDASNKTDLFYCTIRNIPSHMRSKDLREYFSDYVECGKFHCFHYRHRPEYQQESFLSTPGTSKENSGNKASTSCCVISFSSPNIRSDFIQDFHGRHWINSEGMEIPRRCFISAVKVAKRTGDSSDCVDDADLRKMIEFRPPLLMPRGNVGTPTQYFLDQIRLCRLPPSLIPKLGLKATRRKRKYDSVPFHYYPKDMMMDTEQVPRIISRSQANDSIRRDVTRKELLEEEQSIADESTSSDPTDNIQSTDIEKKNESESDDDQCEEWERHEALHDDVTEQDRIKPRKYEEEMEIVWEKGGPGLVWYTDKNYWDKIEKGTDCDWAWADDWDVDYSVYYEGKSGATKDARDAVEMKEDEDRSTGKLVESVFTKKRKTLQVGRRRRNSDSDITNFEEYTKGIGSKLLSRMGWTPGSGLGRSQQGRVQPVALQLEEDGQTGSEKKGFGYHGEKMQRTGFMKPAKLHAIASSFDAVTDKIPTPYKRVGNVATGDILFRRSELTKMKYRPDVKELKK